jgi:hypothetical protein
LQRGGMACQRPRGVESLVARQNWKRIFYSNPNPLQILGLVHFKYSQRSEPEPRPPSVKDDYMTPEYVDKVCAGMKRDLEFDNITKIRLLEGGQFEFVHKGADGQDEILKDLNIHWGFYYIEHYAHKFKDDIKLPSRMHNRPRLANQYFITSAPVAAPAAGPRTADVGSGVFSLFDLLLDMGYSRDAHDIVRRVHLITGRDDPKALLAVDVDVLADALDLPAFKRQMLKRHISEFREAVIAGQTAQQFINHLRARSAHLGRTCLVEPCEDASPHSHLPAIK